MMTILFSVLCLFSVLVLLHATNLAAAATLLPQDEVHALKEITETLGKSNWNFSADPCDVEGEWGNIVTCENYTDAHNITAPHIISIYFQEQSLNGTLPPQLFRLPYLDYFDVSRNYLNGTIPKEWGYSTNLNSIYLLGNRLTGPIPKELGNISTLGELDVESNWLSGPLPPELGNLFQLNKLRLTSNNFTGELPQTFVNFTSLDELRLSDNQFTGKIPSFIQNLTILNILIIQGSGLKGPIPSGIAFLEGLSDLRLSDFDGPESQVPKLRCRYIETLILRSCNLTGELPAFLPQMTNLKILDLSFNKLSGEIPISYSNLERVGYIYLTGNQLTGEVPVWILAKGKNVDLSYNNFTARGSECQNRSVNLFASSKVENATSHSATSGLVSCLQSRHCTKNRYSLFINCGGNKAKIRGTTYEDDSWEATPSSFFGSDYWACSSTSYFTDYEIATYGYTVKNTSGLPMNDAQLYMKARRSAISLTYYGFCLMDGPYNVFLHFAEIMFTDDKTYQSLGRRAFNIYIQGILVWKDFNIEIEAGGVRKEVTRNFSAYVTNGTLEIRFYWAGKGTTAIPDRGVYGPLISAISVYPGFDPPASKSAGTLAGILAAIVFVVFLILVILWWRGCLGRKDKMAQGGEGVITMRH